MVIFIFIHEWLSIGGYGKDHTGSGDEGVPAPLYFLGWHFDCIFLKSGMYLPVVNLLCISLLCGLWQIWHIFSQKHFFGRIIQYVTILNYLYITQYPCLYQFTQGDDLGYGRYWWQRMIMAEVTVSISSAVALIYKRLCVGCLYVRKFMC